MKIAVNTSISTGDLSFSELEELGELVYFRDAPTEELKVLAADCDAIMINKEEITEELLAACPKVKYIGVFATGYNVVNLAACRKRGITVTNVPGYSTNSVAQHVLGLAFISARFFCKVLSAIPLAHVRTLRQDVRHFRLRQHRQGGCENRGRLRHERCRFHPHAAQGLPF